VPTLSNVTQILDSIMNELRIPVSNLSERTKITNVVSGVYGDICAKTSWWWLQQNTVQNTTPKITAGTISVTENSSTVTFSTVPQQFSVNVSVAGFVITFPGNSVDSQSVFRIDTHTAGLTTATLDAPYTGSTDTAAAYRVYQTGYTLPQVASKVLFVKRYGRAEPLEKIGIEDLSFLQMNRQQEGKPQVWSVFDFATPNLPSSRRLLQIWPYPDQAYRMEIWYKHMHQDDITSDLDLPKDYQHVLLYGGLARCYAIFLNDLDRSSFFQNLFNDVMALMTSQQREYASDAPGIKTDMRGYRSGNVRGRWPGRSLGSYFDILPNVP
jgi:hypothetical protein